MTQKNEVNDPPQSLLEKKKPLFNTRPNNVKAFTLKFKDNIYGSISGLNLAPTPTFLCSVSTIFASHTSST